MMMGVGLGCCWRPLTPIFSPADLFALGEAGAYYAPWDLSSMTIGRDGSGGAPGIGDVVGKIFDKSGNGFHLVAPSDAARPQLLQDVDGRYYLKPDAVDDCLLNSSAALFEGDNAWTAVWASGRGGNGLFHWSYSTFTQAARIGGATELRFANEATSFVAVATGVTDAVHVFTAEATAAAVGANDLSARVDGVAGTSIERRSGVTETGLALFSAQPVSFSTGTDAAFYGGVWINRALTTDERASLESYLAEKSGVTLP